MEFTAGEVYLIIAHALDPDAPAMCLNNSFCKRQSKPGTAPLKTRFAGGVFVAEAGSVMIQRGWFKLTKRTRGVGQRVFLMAPLHHHFEKKGWYESQVVTRFYILCILCAVVALSTLKLR